MSAAWIRNGGLARAAIACLLVTLGLGASTIASLAATTCPIPFEKGTQWTYEGEVQWTVSGTAQVKTAHIQWVSEVVGSVKSANAQAAVARGFPDELAWYEPGQSPSFCVLLSVSNRVYRVREEGQKQALGLARRLVANPRALPQAAEAILELPLAVGHKWDQDPAREDTWYCWCVEKVQKKEPSVKGFDNISPLNIYTLAYRTNPDHQLVDIAPGLGIVRYVYNHHGTVASADVRLISFRRPDHSSAKRKTSTRE